MPTTRLISRTEPFTALADVFQSAGFASYSASIGPELINLAYGLDWTGRSLLDLGCGTGNLACFFGRRGFRVVGVDSSAAMLRHGMAEAERDHLGAQFVQTDMRGYRADTQVEMVTCLGGALNYMPTMRDLESVFRVAAAALEPGKLFVFDLHTIQGLADMGCGDEVLSDQPDDHLIVTRSSFSYESLSLTRVFHILRGAGPGWLRFEETHILRGYPVQGVTRLLGPAGLKLVSTLTPDLQPAEGQREAKRLVFVTQRE